MFLVAVFGSVREVAKNDFLASSRLPSWNNNWPATGQTFITFDVRVFFENLSRKFKFCYKVTRITDAYVKVCVQR